MGLIFSEARRRPWHAMKGSLYRLNMEQVAALYPPEMQKVLFNMKAKVDEFFAGKMTASKDAWKGYRCELPVFSVECAKYAYEEMEVEPNSVFIVSFPKTGTNWSMEVVRQIMYGHDPVQDKISKSLPMPLIVLEASFAEKFQLQKHIPLQRRLYGTHLPEELFNVEKAKKSKSKIIVVLRNPKDQAVSWYHFAQNRGFDSVREQISSDWSQFFEDYVQGKHPTLSKDGEWYPEHILGWYKYRDDKDFLFLYFEDMKKDIKKEIRRIAKFLDVSLNDERVDSIAESTTFSSMKKKADMKQGDIAKIQSALNMMRKGQVGEWKEKFTVAQSELMDKLIEEKLGDTDIRFCYEL